MPADTVSIYTGGSALTRKKDEPPPPAGYGFVAVTGGQGRDHVQGTEVAQASGHIVAGQTPGVHTTTENLAALVAFVEAIRAAGRQPDMLGRPICIRYCNCYAANVCTGAWKAKKHRAMAEVGRQLWRQLQQETRGRVWMQRVSPKSRGMRHIEKAESLAREARVTGLRTYRRSTLGL